MAGNIKGITVEIAGNTSKLSQALKSVNKDISGTQSALKQVDRLLKLDPTNTELLAQKEKLLAQAIEQAKTKVDALKQAQEQAKATLPYYDQWKAKYDPIKSQIDQTREKITSLTEKMKAMEEAGNIDTDEYKELQVQVSEANDALKDLQNQAKAVNDEFGNPISSEQYDQLTRDVIGAEQALGQLENATEDAGEQAEEAANGGWTVFKGVVADLASNAIQAAIEKLKEFGESVMETGTDFETANSQLAATMGQTTDQISELTDFAKEMGRTTSYTATESAEGLNTLAQSGADAEEQMELLPDTMNLAKAGAIGLSEAAGDLTTTIKGYGDEASNAQKYTDIMTAGATLANTTVGELGAALAESSANANSYGQSVEGVSLALLELADQGEVGSSAATSLNRAMADLYTPTDEAKSALDALKVSAYNADGTTRDFNDVCNDLQDALSGMSEEEANSYKNTIFTTNGLNAFNKICATSDASVQKFKDGIATASDAMGGQGAAAQQAATQMDNLSGDMTLFDSALDGLKMQIYDLVNGPVRAAVQAATTAVTWMTENQTAVGAIAAVLGVLAVAILAYNISMNAAAIATAATTAATTAFGAALAFATAPITLIVIGIAALIAIIVLCVKHWQQIKTVAINVANAIRTGVANAFDALKTKVSSTVESIKSAVVDKFNAVKTTVTSIFNAVKTSIANAMNSAKTTVSNAISAIKSAFNFVAQFKIKIPHISVSAGVAPYGIGGAGSLPKFTVTWKRDAVNAAQILNNATIFGAAGNSLIGGGETQPEIISGEAHLMDMISDASGGGYVQGIYRDLHNLANGGLYNTFNRALSDQPNMTLREFSRMVKQCT